jgi:hypothetical protein
MDEEAGRRIVAILEHAGDAMLTDTASLSSLLRTGKTAS